MVHSMEYWEREHRQREWELYKMQEKYRYQSQSNPYGNCVGQTQDRPQERMPEVKKVDNKLLLLEG